MDRLAARAVDGYREIVRGHPDFVPYFRSATPEPELGQLEYWFVPPDVVKVVG